MNYDLGQITGRAAVMSAVSSGNGGNRRAYVPTATMRPGCFVMCPSCVINAPAGAYYTWQMMAYQAALRRSANSQPVVRPVQTPERAFSRN